MNTNVNLNARAKQTRDGRRMASGERRNTPLLKHVGELRDFSASMIVLAELAPERMTMAQGIFFLLAATADLKGNPATFSAIRETVGPVINRSLHTTYKVLLQGPSRKDNPKQKGLDWLYRETNPEDEREKFLRLTERGRVVIISVIIAITGDEGLVECADPAELAIVEAMRRGEPIN